MSGSWYSLQTGPQVRRAKTKRNENPGRCGILGKSCCVRFIVEENVQSLVLFLFFLSIERPVQEYPGTSPL